MDQFYPFLAATIIGTVVAAIGLYFAKRAGLGPVQSQYIHTLEGNNAALNERLDIVVEDLQREKHARATLAQKVVRLERTVVHLAEENTHLRTRLNMPHRPLPVDVADYDIENLTDPELGHNQ